MSQATVLGTNWSVASWDVRRLLDCIGAPYRFVDFETDDEARAMVQNLGREKEICNVIPVVRLPDGTVLVGATRYQVAVYYGVRLDTGMLNVQSLHKDMLADVSKSGT